MTNAEMDSAVQAMSNLHETGKLGYAIARNLRILKTECTEYLQLKAELFEELGDRDGNQYSIPPDKIPEYIERLGDIPSIDHEVNLYTITEEEFLSGTLTSDQMEALLFMVQEA
ncbi:MAG: hypothetical protein LIP02_13730 [Bacteroidales bacterium]|nr:hypothetical protein [Bacteroidales bacterium]MCC8177388.1 hypothetical protein [Bacteroidales bacterium]